MQKSGLPVSLSCRNPDCVGDSSPHNKPDKPMRTATSESNRETERRCSGGPAVPPNATGPIPRKYVCAANLEHPLPMSLYVHVQARIRKYSFVCIFLHVCVRNGLPLGGGAEELPCKPSRVSRGFWPFLVCCSARRLTWNLLRKSVIRL